MSTSPYIAADADFERQERRLQLFTDIAYGIATAENVLMRTTYRLGRPCTRTAHGQACLDLLILHLSDPLCGSNFGQPSATVRPPVAEAPAAARRHAAAFVNFAAGDLGEDVDVVRAVLCDALPMPLDPRAVPASKPTTRALPAQPHAPQRARRPAPSAAPRADAPVQPIRAVAVQPPAYTVVDTRVVVPSGDDLYEPYAPERIHIDGTHAHPTPLVQPAAMASVLPPAPCYRPHLPADIVANGLHSAPQLEAVVYAGEAHGSTRGAERIAAAWADSRTVAQIAFKPDWTRDGTAAPFKRNDRMLDVVPVGLVAFPGSGITGNAVGRRVACAPASGTSTTAQFVYSAASIALYLYTRRRNLSGALCK